MHLVDQDTPEQHVVPATSRTLPSSHGEPERFWPQTPAAACYLMGAVGLLIILGIASVILFG